MKRPAIAECAAVSPAPSLAAPSGGAAAVAAGDCRSTEVTLDRRTSRPSGKTRVSLSTPLKWTHRLPIRLHDLSGATAPDNGGGGGGGGAPCIGGGPGGGSGGGMIGLIGGGAGADPKAGGVAAPCANCSAGQGPQGKGRRARQGPQGRRARGLSENKRPSHGRRHTKRKAVGNT